MSEKTDILDRLRSARDRLHLRPTEVRPLLAEAIEEITRLRVAEKDLSETVEIPMIDLRTLGSEGR